ncbi:MAG: ABC transporter ATP-binding protein [Caldilineaceae bacterium]|nr:ABC transporter ATP-binding protein [Caldilineaceae bacterium]
METSQIATQAETQSKNGQPLLEVKGLKTYFYTEDGVVQAINGVDFAIRPGEVMGLVGESGSGKSVTSLSIMRLLSASGKIVSGEILLGGHDLVTMPEDELVQLRGDEISMIFQQPASSLNPVFRIGDQIAETIMIHQDLSKQEAWQQAVEMLRKVGIPDAARRATAFPHEISGGQAQRVMIAMALSCLPKLLIADEPTTALDVTIQAQILDLMRKLRSETGTAILLITHDMGVIAEMCDSVAVMYAGQIVEYADVITLFDKPLHPYTEGLLAAIPVLGDVRESLAVIPGSVPNLIDLPPACKFAARCPYVKDLCTETETRLIEVEPGHSVRCFMRDPATAHLWAGVERTDWRFEGDEVFVEPTEGDAAVEIEPGSNPGLDTAERL